MNKRTKYVIGVIVAAALIGGIWFLSKGIAMII